jgi:outer membrane lipoprotein-sorting protein
MRKISFSASFALITLLGLNVAAQEDAMQIMQKSQDAMTIAGSESISSLTISDGKGNQRIRKFSSAQKADPSGKMTKTVMRFLEPADVKGTGILTFDHENSDDDMWLYMPAFRKVRRIVSSEKTKAFMGSEFTNSDITKPSMTEYAYKLLGSEKIGDVDCWKIESVPASQGIINAYGYSKRISWIGKADYTARKTEFYDLDAQIKKVLKTEKVTLLDEKNKKYQPVDITMENKQNGRSSRFIIEKVVFNPSVKEEYFTTDYLEK